MRDDKASSRPLKCRAKSNPVMCRRHHPDKPFKALVLKNLYQSKSANNHGFLSSVLRAEKILLPDEKQKLAHTKGDPKPFTTAMQKLIKEQVSLEDEVAIADEAKEAKRQELIANMKKVAKETSAK